MNLFMWCISMNVIFVFVAHMIWSLSSYRVVTLIELAWMHLLLHWTLPTSLRSSNHRHLKIYLCIYPLQFSFCHLIFFLIHSPHPFGRFIFDIHIYSMFSFFFLLFTCVVASEFCDGTAISAVYTSRSIVGDHYLVFFYFFVIINFIVIIIVLVWQSVLQYQLLLLLCVLFFFFHFFSFIALGAYGCMA